MKRRNHKKTIWYLSLLLFLLSLRTGEALSQPVSKEEPEIRLGEITIKLREFELKPSPIKILELHIEILNRSRKAVAPPNSIKVVVTPKEMKFSATGDTSQFPSAPEEVTLNLSLPPGAGQGVIVGFPFPKEDVESTTFEVQINPPNGERKMVTWEKS